MGLQTDNPIHVQAPPAETNRPCRACGAPREGASRFCTACGSPLETVDVPIVATPTGQNPNGDLSDTPQLPSRAFECKNCGSQVATSVDQRSYVCPFCDSAYVTEIPPNQSGRRRPEFVIGFTVTPEQALEKYVAWLGKNRWFRPGDLASKVVTEKNRGVYLPFWHFSMATDSRWSAGIGEYWYKRESYTTTDSKGKRVTKTRRVRKTEWFPLEGHFQRYYFGHLLAATKSITTKEARSIQPFRLSALTRYQPYFLAGWMAEEYSVERESAAIEAEREFRSREQQAVERFLPGDTHNRLQVETQIEQTGSDLILLPVYVLSYKYRNRLFRFLVNGQTGAVIGEKPVSGRRITLVVLAVLTMIAATAIAVVIATG